MKNITLIIPCYNEEDVIEACYKSIKSVITILPNYSFEILFVNDGSKDKTLEIIKDLRKKDSTISYIDFSRNFGKEIALIAGLDYENSDAIVFMDADLQHPPEAIVEMVKWWEDGYDDVCVKRRERPGETWFKKWSSKTYYKVLNKLTRIPIQPGVGDFRLLDRKCVEALKLYRETQRYNKGLCSLIGFRKKEIVIDLNERLAGETKWNFFQLCNLAIEGITSFTIAPLRVASIIGSIFAIIAMIYMAYIVIKTLLLGGDLPGYPSLISVVLFIGGVQLLFLGIIGEYLGRVFNESKNRPLYLVNEFNDEKIVEQHYRRNYHDF